MIKRTCFEKILINDEFANIACRWKVCQKRQKVKTSNKMVLYKSNDFGVFSNTREDKLLC